MNGVKVVHFRVIFGSRKLENYFFLYFGCNLSTVGKLLTRRRARAWFCGIPPHGEKVVHFLVILVTILVLLESSWRGGVHRLGFMAFKLTVRKLCIF